MGSYVQKCGFHTLPPPASTHDRCWLCHWDLMSVRKIRLFETSKDRQRNFRFSRARVFLGLTRSFKREKQGIWDWISLNYPSFLLQGLTVRTIFSLPVKWPVTDMSWRREVKPREAKLAQGHQAYSGGGHLNHFTERNLWFDTRILWIPPFTYVLRGDSSVQGWQMICWRNCFSLSRESIDKFYVTWANFDIALTNKTTMQEDKIKEVATLLQACPQSGSHWGSASCFCTPPSDLLTSGCCSPQTSTC